MHWGNGGITPYNMYDNWLDHTLVNGCQHRWRLRPPEQPEVQAMLANDRGRPAEQRPAGHRLPAAAEVRREPTCRSSRPSPPPQWFEANSRHFTGWPTQSNPYETGQPSGTNNGPGTGTDEYVILHLKPVS